METKKVIFESPGKVILKTEELPPLTSNKIRVRHLYSLISAGTEVLTLTGEMGSSFPMNTGYSSVGQIIDGWEGSPFMKDQIVSCFGLHASIVDYEKDYAKKIFLPVPEEYTKQATFLKLGCVAMHGLHVTDFKLGQWIVVFGLGIVGNLTAQLAQLYTGGRVIGIDPIKQRRRIAEKVGIKTLDPDTDDIIQSVKEITGNGADIVIEASGSQHALDKAMEITTYRGKIAVVGGHYGKREIDLKTNFQNKELSIIGARRIDKFTEESLYDKWPPKKYNNLILELIKNGDISIEPLISHEIKPEDAQDIYKRLIKKDPDVFGAVFDWTQSTTI